MIGFDRVDELVGTAASVGRNATEWLMHGGGLQVDEDYSPYAVVASGQTYRLRRYFPDDLPPSTGAIPSLVFVPPLMIKADVYDIAPRSSPVRAVHENGVDVWVVDFGPPEEEPGGLERTVADHVLALSEVVDHVRAATGRNVVLSGYSQGGLFGYQTTAYRRNDGVDSVVTFGSVVDFQSGAPLPIPMSPQNYEEFAQDVLDLGIFRHTSLPGWAARSITKMIDPVAATTFYVNYFRTLHDRDEIMRGEKQRQFLDQNGWAAYPGPAMNDLMAYVAHNRLLTGGFVVGERVVALSDVEVPILIAVGERDAQGPPAGVRAVARAAPRAEVHELTLDTGHFGIIASSGARKRTWPRVAGWLRWRAGLEPLPDGLVPAAQVTSTRAWSPSASTRRIQWVVDLGWGVSRTAVRMLSGAAGAAGSLAAETGRRLPGLNHLDALAPAIEISLSLLLDESCRIDPDGTLLLVGDRAIRRSRFKHRVDSVVRGLVGAGVREGDRVGVLMGSRPSGLSLVAALNRMGAVAVLLRPDGDTAREAALGEVAFVVSDPENAGRITTVPRVRWCVLGGRTAEQDLPDDAVDLERVDPDTVTMPAWYRPNPHRGADLAFVLFTGEGPSTAARHITNRRWALSALGTVRASGLKPSDTVYSTTPVHHGSALLMAVGGAIAGDARLALAGRADPDTFWTEIRRYGATHVTYTWNSLQAVTDGPRHVLERGHPIRQFLGSGMPLGLGERVRERFAPASVLEFYASPDGEVILADTTGSKPGSMGRPLPGTAEVAVVAWDPGTRRLQLGPDGLSRECATGEAGLLVEKAAPGRPVDDPLRSVLVPGDEWGSTGDLFRADVDGDLWLVGPADGLIETTEGRIAPSEVRDALGAVPGVGVAAAYGVPNGDGSNVLVGVVTRSGRHGPRKIDIEVALADLPQECRPVRVLVLAEMPLTTWSRPDVRHLRDEGLPVPQPGRVVWQRQHDGRSYRRLTGRAGSR